MGIEKGQIINTNYLFYHPLVDKSPIGAVEKGKDINISLSFPSNFVIWDIDLVIEDDNKVEVARYKLDSIDNKYHITFKIEEQGLYWYYFEFSDCYGRHGIYAGDDLGGSLSDDRQKLYELLIHDSFCDETNWFDQSIMYQIMPDRFYRAGDERPKDYVVMHNDWYEDPFYKPVGKDWNIDFYGGDIKGIINKLDYLKSLNINVIYLNPIFLAKSSHKYDVGNYLEIDPMYGTETDFSNLCKKAKAKGIRIILDMVFNHTGDDSLYFNKYGTYPSVGAYQSKASPYRDWYTFGKYFKNGYRAWWDIETLPALNQNCEGYLNLISDTLKKWIGLGASGVRLDVVDELNNDVVNHINSVCKGISKDIIVIGEVWEDASNKIAYGVRKQYFNGHQLDSVMNYVFKKAIISFLKDGNYHYLRDSIRMLINNYPKYAFDKMMNIVDTHDTMRLVNNFYKYIPKNKADAAKFKVSDEVRSQAILKQKMATVLQFSLPGIPCIYYGDEAGLDGFDDPFCRRTYPWGRENKDLMELYKKLTKARLNPVFNGGSYQEIKASPSQFIFKRIKDGVEVLVIINNSNVFYEENISAYDLLEDKNVNIIHVSPYEAKMYEIKR